MSDKPISVGDLVVVLKPTPCCGRSDSVGLHFTVDALKLPYARPCHWCGIVRTAPAAIYRDIGAFDLYRLKRIPPPGELGIVDEKTEEPSHVG